VSRTLFVGLLCFVGACGGGTKPEVHSGGETPARESGGMDSAENGAADVAPAAPRLPSCEDGTCFTCGETICMAGFYCDADAPGGAACSWLPACAERGACGCLKRELGAECRCEERSGGPHVTCS
jgi:hypothetical protein